MWDQQYDDLVCLKLGPFNKDCNIFIRNMMIIGGVGVFSS